MRIKVSVERGRELQDAMNDGEPIVVSGREWWVDSIEKGTTEWTVVLRPVEEDGDD